MEAEEVRWAGLLLSCADDKGRREDRWMKVNSSGAEETRPGTKDRGE